MRKLILFNLVTVDGFFEGKNGDINWHNVDEEFNEFAISQLKQADALLFGRKTYELMRNYWPAEKGEHDSAEIAHLMNSMEKYVFSRTMQQTDWNNSQLIRENGWKEIERLKNREGKNILIFGSAELFAGLLDKGLVDEMRIVINPVLLGSGEPLFKNREYKISLQLLKAKVFGNGNVLLTYHLSK